MWLPKIYSLTSFLYGGQQFWNSLPFFIKVCFIIALIATVGIILAMVHIAILRTFLKWQEKKIAFISAKVNELLLSTIVLEPHAQETGMIETDFDITQFYNLGLSDSQVKNVLVTEFISYRSYFSGKIAERIRKLYLRLSLHKDAIASLYKKRWETKVNGLSELFKMDVEVDHAYLRELLKDKNSYIREYARLSLIKFAKGDPLQFLHELNEPISQWEEFEIFQLLQQRENFTLASLEGLISVDKEPTVASLCLRLAVYFKQQAAIPFIIGLIETPNLALRVEAIAALGQLEAKDAAKYLINIYPEQPHNIRLTVLTALGKIRSARYLDFLENEFFSSSDFEIKKYASDAIIKLYPISKSAIDKMSDSGEPLNQSILNHSLDPLINAS